MNVLSISAGMLASGLVLCNAGISVAQDVPVEKQSGSVDKMLSSLENIASYTATLHVDVFKELPKTDSVAIRQDSPEILVSVQTLAKYAAPNLMRIDVSRSGDIVRAGSILYTPDDVFITFLDDKTKLLEKIRIDRHIFANTPTFEAGFTFSHTGLFRGYDLIGTFGQLTDMYSYDVSSETENLIILSGTLTAQAKKDIRTSIPSSIPEDIADEMIQNRLQQMDTSQIIMNASQGYPVSYSIGPSLSEPEMNVRISSFKVLLDGETDKPSTTFTAPENRNDYTDLTQSAQKHLKALYPTP